jgi:hypothetical protein
MEITNDDRQIMISTLQSLHRNSVDDLLVKIKFAKDKLSTEIYQLMLNGDEFIYGDDIKVPFKEQYRKVSLLEGRWCLKSIIYYNYTRTEKVSKEEYNKIMTKL